MANLAQNPFLELKKSCCIVKSLTQCILLQRKQIIKRNTLHDMQNGHQNFNTHKKIKCVTLHAFVSAYNLLIALVIKNWGNHGGRSMNLIVLECFNRLQTKFIRSVHAEHVRCCSVNEKLPFVLAPKTLTIEERWTCFSFV